MIEFSGIAFRQVDNRVMSLQLVQLGLSNAAMFARRRRGAAAVGGAVQEADPGRARQLPPGHAREHRHAALRPREVRTREPGVAGGEVVAAHGDHDAQPAWPDGRRIDLRDFLARADVLAACGKTVLISDYFEYYRLAAYLPRYTEQADRHHDGRRQPARAVRREVLRAARRRHPRIVRPAVQERPEALRLSAARPAQRRADHRRRTSRSPPSCASSTSYLVERGCIEQLDNYNPEYLHIFSRDILRKIKSGDPAWSDGAPQSRRGDPAARLLRLREGLAFLVRGLRYPHRGGSMTRKQKPVRRPGNTPVPAGQVRDILRDLARWAVASSVGLSGACSSVHEPGPQCAKRHGQEQRRRRQRAGAARSPGCSIAARERQSRRYARSGRPDPATRLRRDLPQLSGGLGMGGPYPAGTGVLAQSGKPCARRARPRSAKPSWPNSRSPARLRDARQLHLVRPDEHR